MRSAYSTNLTSVTIPDSVLSIGPFAFRQCTSLTNVIIGNSVDIIWYGAFSECIALTSVNIPDSVTSIRNSAFSWCTSLTSVNIGNSLASIETFVFDNCTSLTDITVDAANPNYSSVDGVMFNKLQTLLIQCPGGKTGSYTIPDSVTSIGIEAFLTCTSLQSVTIPDSVTNIGPQAFGGCYSLTSVTIGNGVTNIGNYAFGFCYDLAAVYFEGNVPTTEGPDVFNGTDNVTVYYLTEGWGATFAGRPAVALYTYDSNDGAITITGYNGVGGAVAIQDTINGLPVTSIGDSAFSNNTSLTSVTIPGSVTGIGTNAFDACTNLTSVTIGNGVTNIGSSAFVDCTSLTAVYFEGDVPTTVGTDVFSNADNVTVYYLPGTAGWGATFAGRPTAAFPFSYTTNAGDITITGYTGTTSVVAIPATITGLPVRSIGNNAFQSKSSLTSATIGNSVTSIGDRAFYHCYILTNITVDAGNPNYSSVDGVLFDKLQTLLIQHPPGKAGSYTIPDSVISIGSSAFEYSIGLTNVTIPDSVTSIGARAFHSCPGLASVTIGNSVASIGNNAFEACIGLTSVAIPDSVSSIGAEAFWYCTALMEVYFEGNAPIVGLNVFGGGTPATVYYLPGTTGWGAFFAGRPAVLWNPMVQTGGPNFGVQGNQFGFDIAGPTNAGVVVEASADLTSPDWTPVGTNTLTGGSFYFSDPQWTNYPGRFYRLVFP